MGSATVGTSTPSVILSVRDLRTHYAERSSGIKRRRGSIKAVDGVSFDVGRGETLGLVGESGCGKTTLGRSLLRLVKPVGGRVLLDGFDVLRASPAELRSVRRDMQLVFQDVTGSLNPRMSVGSIVAEPLLVHRVVWGEALRRQVAALLDRVGLRPTDAERYPHELSGGQRQRVGIARAVALNPKFIVCDEPVSALDVSIQSQVLNLLRDLQRDLQLSYLFIAHNLAVVEYVSDRVAVMYLGKIVELADADRLYRDPQHPYTRALLDSIPQPQAVGQRRAAPLTGELPDPADPPAGCPFHPRCPIAVEDCRRFAPELERRSGLAPGHLVACHAAGTPDPRTRSDRHQAASAQHP